MNESIEQHEQNRAQFRRDLARNAAESISEIVDNLHRLTGNRVRVTLFEDEITTYGDLWEGKQAFVYSVEVRLSDEYIGRA